MTVRVCMPSEENSCHAQFGLNSVDEKENNENEQKCCRYTVEVLNLQGKIHDF